MRNLWVLRGLWETTIGLIQPYATRGVESGCFWYGTRTESAAFAVTVGIPFQVNRRRNFEIPSEAMAALVGRLPSSDLVAVAQIHTHPGEDTAHSPWDDDLVVSRKIYSLVLPRYGKLPCPTDTARIHRFAEGRWLALDPADATERIRVLPDVIDTRSRT
jgi:hypothetical protein